MVLLIAYLVTFVINIIPFFMPPTVSGQSGRS